MNPERPGWKTSEFWIALVSQVVALLTSAGWITPADRPSLEHALAAAITAVFTIAASVVVVLRYIDARTKLKEKQMEQNPPTLRVLPFVLLGIFLLPAFATAQPVTQKTYLLPWRERMYRDWLELRQQRAQPQTDPALTQALAQIAANQQLILNLLQQRQAAPTQPQVIVLGPYQQIPLGTPPKQDIPLGTPPKQDVPLGGPPRQDVPLGPPPKQDIPLGPPPQAIPLGPATPQQPAQRYVPTVRRILR